VIQFKSLTIEHYLLLAQKTRYINGGGITELLQERKCVFFFPVHR